MKAVDLTTLGLLVVGGLNWGLVGAADVDLVALIVGEMSALSRIVYLLVGASALWQAARLPAMQSRLEPVPATRTTGAR